MSFYFEKLIVWQKAYLLSKQIHTLIRDFPKEEQYALIDQLRRSSLSVVSNIAEWSARVTDADRKHFLTMAQGSCMEVATQIMLADDFGYIKNQEEKEHILSLLDEIVKMLYAMVNK